jgi:peptidoglycan hydrolase CwlO-like protein
MNRIFNSVVLITLAFSLALVSCTQEVKTSDFENLKAEVEALNNQLKATDIDYKTQITTLRFIFESYKSDVTPQLVALNEQMKADYEVLSAADVLLGQQLEEAQATLQAAIDQDAEDIAANAEAIQTAIAEYKKLVADAIKGYEAAIAKAREDQAFVDGVQDEVLATLASQMDTYKEAIEEAVAALSGAIDDLAAAMEETQGSIEDLAAAIAELEEKVDANLAAAIAYTDALEATVKATTDALAERIAANEAAIKKLNEETIPEIGDAIDALEASMVGLEGNLEALEEKKLDQDVFQDFLTTFIEWMGKVETDIASFNGTLEQLQLLGSAMDNEIKDIEEMLDVLNGDESVKCSVKQQIKALHEDVIEHLNELKGEIESEIQDLEDELAGIQEDLEAINADIVVINGQIDAANTAIIELNGTITTAEGNIAELQAAKTVLESKITALGKLLVQKEEEIKALLPAIEEKIALINGDKDTKGSIAYAVDQLDQAIQTQMGLISGRIDKTDAEIAKLQKEIGKLQQYIQSLVFVPQYQDLKFGIPFIKVGNVYKDYNVGSGFAVVYKVAPAYLAQPLAKAVNDAIAAGVALPFTFDIDSELQTRAADTDPQLFIKDATGDDKTGKMTFFLSHKNFDPAGGNLDKYAISLRADNTDYNVHVASEYVQAKLHAIAVINVDYDHIYKPDVTKGEVDPGSEIAKDELKTLDIEYTDGEAHTSIFEGYEMAGTDQEGKKRTFSQFKALGYDMPEVKVNVAKYEGDCVSIADHFDGSASTFSVKIKDGDNDNMKVTKTHINQNKKYSFGFTDGVGTVTANLQVTIKQHTGTFHLKVPYTMRWEYIRDAYVDYLNRDKNPAAWEEGYVRSYHLLEVKPTLTVGTENRVVDGSNKVFGLTVDDFAGKSFAFDGTPFPAGIKFDFNVYEVDSAKKTISLTRLEVKGVRLGETYSCTGTYNLPPYSTGGDSTTVTITTVDRYMGDIQITVPAIKVKLLGDQYNTSKKSYDIESVDFSNALMAAYKAKGVLPPDYSKNTAFSTWGEFDMMDGCLEVITAEGIGANFGFETTTYIPFYIRMYSKEGKLKSDILHQIASGSDCENKPWTIVMRSRVGLKIYITWPISVEPKYDYRFVTNGQDTFQVPIGWQGGPDAITKVQTELDLLNFSNYVQVKYNEGGTEHEVTPAHYKDNQFRLIPRFSLVNATQGVAVVDSPAVTGLDCISNVTYYSQVPSVGVKSSLYVKSDNTEFLVSGSDKMYVNGAPVESITVKQSNPIAAEQTVPVPPTNLDASGEGLVELTMQDVLGNKLYDLGHIQDNTGSYKDTVKKIFGSVKFSVYTVNGSSATAGWSIKGANSFGVSDTPDDVKLITNGVSAGTYTVVIKANTVWKDNYFYSVKVNVQ